MAEGNDGQPNAAYVNGGDGSSFARVQLGDGDPDVVSANAGGVNKVYRNRPSER